MNLYASIAHEPAFLCGDKVIWYKPTISRRLLAARSGPALGSTWEFVHLFVGHDDERDKILAATREAVLQKKFIFRKIRRRE